MAKLMVILGLTLVLMTPAGNMIPNGSFEPPDGLWKVYRGGLPVGGSLDSPVLDCSFALVGSCSTRIEVTGAAGVSSDGGGISQPFALNCSPCVASIATFGIYSPTVVLRWGVFAYNANGQLVGNYDDDYQGGGAIGEWVTRTLTFTPAAGVVYARAHFHLWEWGFGCGYRYIDNFTLTAGAATN